MSQIPLLLTCRLCFEHIEECTAVTLSCGDIFHVSCFEQVRTELTECPLCGVPHQKAFPVYMTRRLRILPRLREQFKPKFESVHEDSELELKQVVISRRERNAVERRLVSRERMQRRLRRCANNNMPVIAAGPRPSAPGVITPRGKRAPDANVGPGTIPKRPKLDLSFELKK